MQESVYPLAVTLKFPKRNNRQGHKFKRNFAVVPSSILRICFSGSEVLILFHGLQRRLTSSFPTSTLWNDSTRYSLSTTITQFVNSLTNRKQTKPKTITNGDGKKEKTCLKSQMHQPKEPTETTLKQHRPDKQPDWRRSSGKIQSREQHIVQLHM